MTPKELSSEHSACHGLSNLPPEQMTAHSGVAVGGWVHGQELTRDQAVWHLNVTKTVSYLRTPYSLDFRQEGGSTIAFYLDGPDRGKVKFERWESPLEDELHDIGADIGRRS